MTMLIGFAFRRRLALAVLIGIAIGIAGGRSTGRRSRRHWPELRPSDARMDDEPEGLISERLETPGHEWLRRRRPGPDPPGPACLGPDTGDQRRGEGGQDAHALRTASRATHSPDLKFPRQLVRITVQIRCSAARRGWCTLAAVC